MFLFLGVFFCFHLSSIPLIRCIYYSRRPVCPQALEAHRLQVEAAQKDCADMQRQRDDLAVILQQTRADLDAQVSDDVLDG